jgi:hypothetical protein
MNWVSCFLQSESRSTGLRFRPDCSVGLSSMQSRFGHLMMHACRHVCLAILCSFMVGTWAPERNECSHRHSVLNSGHLTLKGHFCSFFTVGLCEEPGPGWEEHPALRIEGIISGVTFMTAPFLWTLGEGGGVSSRYLCLPILIFVYLGKGLSGTPPSATSPSSRTNDPSHMDLVDFWV